MQISRDEARRPDVATAQLKKGFEWTAKHSTAVVVLVGGALIIGLGFTVWSWSQDRKETSLQEKFYQSERIYTEKKEKFDQFEADSKKPADPKAKTPQEKPAGEKATGDLDKDYGQAVEGMNALVQEAPKTRAAALASLTLAKIYGDYHKNADAVTVLKRTQNAPGTLGVLVRLELGTQIANQGDCKSAMDTWQTLLKDPSSTFVLPQVKLKMALCSENLGQKAQAEDYYKQILAESKDSAAGRSAERYLRVLQAQTGTSL